jgi:1-acyl-sn-glycerol-3-phosphate acyltransferase
MSVIRMILMVIWTFLLMLITPFFVLITFNTQIPLIVARKFFSPVLLKIAGVNLTVKGAENVPLDQPLIFVSNHCSHLDIGTLCRSLPVNLYFIGKKELQWIPIVGWYMFISGQIFIDRKNNKRAVESLRKAALKIKAGKNVVMFPEGTRSKTGELGEFKQGAFHLAIQAGVTIVPVYIKGTYECWPSGSAKVAPSNVVVSIGKPIASMGYSKNQGKELTKKVREQVLSLRH